MDCPEDQTLACDEDLSPDGPAGYLDAEDDCAEDVEIASFEDIDNPAARGRQLFRLQLSETPVSYSGTLFSISWALELVAKPGGEIARQDLLVSPDALPND